MIYTQKRSSKILKGFSLERCKDNDHVRHDAIIGYQRNLHVSNEKPVPMTYVETAENKVYSSGPPHLTPLVLIFL
jgi:hypothetical protein